MSKAARHVDGVSSAMMPLLTPDEVAARLRITRSRVQDLARRKEIDALKVGRYWRFEESAITEYLERARAAAERRS